MSSRPASRGWFWAAVVLTAVKLWLTSGQRIYAIGPAFHDDRLFVDLAAHLANGEWLGPYNQFTLAKGPMFSVFIAGAFLLGLPLVFAQQAVLRRRLRDRDAQPVPVAAFECGGRLRSTRCCFGTR